MRVETGRPAVRGSSRRKRLHAETIAEIKEAARRLLSCEDRPGLSLRGVARGLGLTPGAIYHYYPGLGALTDDLRSDLCEELKLALESAADSVADDAFDRIKGMTVAFRAWALEHPAEFALLFELRSNELAGACDPSYEIGCVFLDEFAEMRRQNMIDPSREALSENCPEPRLDPRLTVLYPDLSPGRVLAFLRMWSTVCGFVMLEVNGHVGWLIPDGRGLFDIELADVL